MYEHEVYQHLLNVQLVGVDVLVQDEILQLLVWLQRVDEDEQMPVEMHHVLHLLVGYDDGLDERMVLLDERMVMVEIDELVYGELLVLVWLESV